LEDSSDFSQLRNGFREKNVTLIDRCTEMTTGKVDTPLLPPVFAGFFIMGGCDIAAATRLGTAKKAETGRISAGGTHQ